MRIFAFVIFLTLLSIEVSAKNCEFENVKFHSDFPVARLNQCDKQNDNEYLLTIEAENYPVNPSPWYAFKVTADKEQRIFITIEFLNGKSRYLPKISTDGKFWEEIPHKVENGHLKFELDVDQKPLWIAGQEIIGNGFYQVWLDSLTKKSDTRVSVLGRSTLNLPIYQLETTNDAKEWIVLLGRMHPPEVTGAMALFPFVETVLFNKDIGENFRERFNILVVPNMNPDGVVAGHWRHNSQGVDLNRDWKTRKQKETKLIHDKLQSIVKSGGKIVYAIDFHSTNKDIFYSMPNDYGAKPASMTEDWLGLLDKALPNFEVVIKPGSNPNRGVFKQYVADVYGVHAITYEMDDNADRVAIKQISEMAAKTLMQSLLSKNRNEF